MTISSLHRTKVSGLVCSVSFWSISVVTGPGCSTGEALDEGGWAELSTDSWDGDEDPGSTPRPPVPSGDDDSCDVGQEGCPCWPEEECADDLICQDGICIPVVGHCGDGLVDDDEECDDGPDNANDAMCTASCTLQVCGDGVAGPTEACDDGNDDDDDDCTNDCAMPGCGDGVIDDGEECDDGNGEQGDGCLNSCLDALCGDGTLFRGVEGCDDGNDDDTDGCTQSCECLLDFDGAGDLDGWELSGDWGLYEGAPQGVLLSAVPFVTQGSVLGTDGNRSMPYPGQHAETSSAITSTFTVPETLRFRSWHVDEGGPINDTKRIGISVDDGATWNVVADCGAGLNEDLPFCVLEDGPREGADWDDVEIDVADFAGLPGRLRFEYDTSDSCCDSEQGWFIDDLNALDCPGADAQGAPGEPHRGPGRRDAKTGVMASNVR